MANFKGCDFAGGRPNPAALAAKGITFVGRYLADSIGAAGSFKNLTATEAQGYLGAGIAIMPIWEGTATEAVDGHYSEGLAHGKAWKAQADRLGVPTSVIAWYTIDTGTAADVSEYERGFADGVSPHPCGIYGDGAELVAAVKRGRVARTWQTNATAWPGGVYAQADIVQQGTDRINGVTMDLNATTSLSGMWGAAVIQAAPTPAPFIAKGGNMQGYIQVASNGNVFHYGDLAALAPLGGAAKLLTGGEVIVDAQVTSTRKGYWLMGNKGSIFAFGDAEFLGHATDGSGFWCFAG